MNKLCSQMTVREALDIQDRHLRGLSQNLTLEQEQKLRARVKQITMRNLFNRQTERGVPIIRLTEPASIVEINRLIPRGRDITKLVDELFPNGS